MTLGEALGYAASALVAASFLMSSVVRLRLVNAAGAALFAAYGWAIGATPVIVTNGLILARGGDRTHERYLRRVGFTAAAPSGPCGPQCTGTCREHAGSRQPEQAT